MKQLKQLIGLDIGGTKCAVILGESDGGAIAIKQRIAFDTDTSVPPDAVIAQFCDIIDDLGVTADAIGVSCGGPLNSVTGTILRPPNLPLWDDVRIVDILTKRYNVPVGLQNDANACAVAEWLYGAGRGTQSMVFLTFGTGFGAGLILDGRLYAGTCDMAGEIGHVRVTDGGPTGFGKLGAFEGYCSGGGIKQLGYTYALSAYQRGVRAQYFNPDDPLNLSAKTIADAADNGCEVAQAVYAESGRVLGHALSLLMDFINPEAIVIGSIYARSENLLKDAAMAVVEQHALPATRAVCKVLSAQLGNAIGDYAALAVAQMKIDASQ